MKHSHTSTPFHLPHRFLLFNGTFLALSIYSLYYLILEPFAGLTWTLAMAIPMWGTAQAFSEVWGTHVQHAQHGSLVFSPCLGLACPPTQRHRSPLTHYPPCT
jgi:hypothetical protein